MSTPELTTRPDKLGGVGRIIHPPDVNDDSADDEQVDDLRNSMPDTEGMHRGRALAHRNFRRITAHVQIMHFGLQPEPAQERDGQQAGEQPDGEF